MYWMIPLDIAPHHLADFTNYLCEIEYIARLKYQGRQNLIIFLWNDDQNKTVSKQVDLKRNLLKNKFFIKVIATFCVLSKKA